MYVCTHGWMDKWMDGCLCKYITSMNTQKMDQALRHIVEVIFEECNDFNWIGFLVQGI